jgi:acyl-CoA reductase-like NAD-dependent aldehyde dehydrogenase
MAPYSLLVDGELLSSDSSFPVLNPSTLAEVGQCPNASQEQVDRACNGASAAKPAWAALGLEKRKEYLLKAATVLEENVEELGNLLVQEQGKPLHVAGKTGEVSWAIGHLRNVASEISLEPEVVNATTKVYRRPCGVVCGITPWNFPVFCSINKWAPALALGNTFVHKPSPFTPLTGLKIGMLLKDVFPKGVFNVVSGDDKLAFNVGAHLSNHSKVNMVSFTGSVPTGKQIAAACSRDMRRFILEAGGNDAAIVLPDSDPKVVAPGIFAGAFNNSGQICCAVKRAYVHESIHDQVVEELVHCAKKAKFGDGFKEGVEYGPLNNKMQFDKVMGLITDTKSLPEAKIHCGGNQMPDSPGYFIEPTIVSGVKEGARIVDEEQFGPVLPVIKYSDEADALRRANASDYGLGGSVWSSDVSKATDLASQLEAGTVWVNTHTDLTGGPFGGFKQSGMGREMGMQADLDSYSEKQAVFVK